MYDFLNTLPRESYFAAANGYSGFTSLFDCIFDRKLLTRTYVIKGGPGTGKSTILKELCKFGNKKGLSHEALFCSSDPYSLDGVILGNGGKSVAFLDGTAPHEQDAKYPGALDEIINLGEGFDKESLYLSRNEIISINEKKKDDYGNAYKFLKLAGEVNKVQRELFFKNVNESFLQDIAEKICERINAEKTDKRFVRYVSSFGRYGYRRLNEFSNGKKIIKIKGDGHTEFFLISLIFKLASNTVSLICPSPFRYVDTEALVIGDTVIMTDSKAQIDVCNYEISKEKTITELKEEEQRLLSLSVESFRKASELHFELEELYKRAVDFKNNDRILQKLKSECINWLNQ